MGCLPWAATLGTTTRWRNPSSFARASTSGRCHHHTPPPHHHHTPPPPPSCRPRGHPSATPSSLALRAAGARCRPVGAITPPWAHPSTASGQMECRWVARRNPKGNSAISTARMAGAPLGSQSPRERAAHFVTRRPAPALRGVCTLWWLLPDSCHDTLPAPPSPCSRAASAASVWLRRGGSGSIAQPRAPPQSVETRVPDPQAPYHGCGVRAAAVAVDAVPDV